MPVEAIKSLGEFYGTSLASRVSGYDRLSNRITWSLGAPMVNVELHQNQVYENISRKDIYKNKSNESSIENTKSNNINALKLYTTLH